jgi:S1-C subfamily serine protease
MILLVLIALLAGGCAQKSDMDEESNLRWLTDEEKSKAIEIALSMPEATSLLEQQEVYTAEVDWIAIEWDGSRATGWRVLDYDVVSEGVPEFVPESAIIYTRVFLRFGDPVQQQVMVAVDLKAEKAVLVEGPYPLGGPLPSKPPVKPKGVPPPREAIVIVKSQSKGDRWGQSSGFVTSSDGHILTFLSEASMIERLEVVLYDGRTFPAKVINIDPVTELACIKIEATDLTTLKFAAGVAPAIGEKLMAVGHSGKEFRTISARVLDPHYTLSSPKDNIPVVKLDAGGEPGFAGGPVVNMAGEAVGVMLAVDPKTGEGFMVQIDRVKEIIE